MMKHSKAKILKMPVVHLEITHSENNRVRKELRAQQYYSGQPLVYRTDQEILSFCYEWAFLASEELRSRYWESAKTIRQRLRGGGIWKSSF